MKDVTVPLFKLEQKVERLESNLAQFQLDVVGKLADQVSFKMSNQMSYYLPKLQNHIDEFKTFKGVVQLKLKQVSEDSRH